MLLSKPLQIPLTTRLAAAFQRQYAVRRMPPAPPDPQRPPSGTAEALVRLAAGSDAAAWSWIAEHEGPIMYRVAARLLGAADAEDACQEALVHIRSGARHFTPPTDGDSDAAARGWLLRVLANTAAMWRRSKRRRIARERDIAVEAIAGEPAESDLEALRLALAELPESLRLPIVLHHLAGQDFATVAGTLGLRPGTARMRAHTGMARLRERLIRSGILVGLVAMLQTLASAEATVPPEAMQRWRSLPGSGKAPAFSTAEIVGSRPRRWRLSIAAAVILGLAVASFHVPDDLAAPATAKAPRTGLGIATSAEWAHEHDRLHPLLAQAGAGIVRHWPAWETVEPEPGRWNWRECDRQVEIAERSGLAIHANLHSRIGWGERGSRLGDDAAWSAYVAASVARYRGRVARWEIADNFNSTRGTAAQYASLVRTAWTAARTADPDCHVGIGCSEADVPFLEQSIRNGAGGCFDFVAVHPYAQLEVALRGHETPFLDLSHHLRGMLQRTGQRDGIEIVISEIGLRPRDERDAGDAQADALAKAIALSSAQGIGTMLWFEGRGPYRQGILDQDWSPRPAYETMRALSGSLGTGSRFAGWWHPAPAVRGIVLDTATEPLLVTWAAARGTEPRLPEGCVLRDARGRLLQRSPGEPVLLSRSPLLVTALPPALIAAARGTASSPCPWRRGTASGLVATLLLGESLAEDGIVAVGGETEHGIIDGFPARRFAPFKRENYLDLDVDDACVGPEDRRVEVVCIVRSVDPALGTGFNLMYESTAGGAYRIGDRYWSQPPGSATWQTVTFSMDDACFANSWGYNLAIRCVGSPGNLWIREVRVRRIDDRRPQTQDF